MKEKRFTKIVCVCLSLALAFSLGMATSLTPSKKTFADEKNAIDSAVGDLSSKLSDTNEAIKIGGDTMYVISDASGSPTKVISPEGDDFKTHDLSSYKQPIDVGISYTLDGEEISAKDIAGKSGKVTIRFDYTNNEKDGDYFMPYIVLSGAMLDDEVFSNVEITHGKAIDDGSRTIAGGIALPGMKQNIDPNGKVEDIQKIPEYIEISADAKEFALDMTLSVVLPLNVSDIELTSLTGISDIGDDMTALIDATSKLLDGTKALSSGTSDLASGSSSLYDGLSTLSQGLLTLSENSESLRQGAASVFATLLETTRSQLVAGGIDVPELTVENYAGVLDKVIESLDEKNVYAQILAVVTTQVRAMFPTAPEEQIQYMIAQQMSSPEVQAKLTAASEGAKKVIAAKAGLDSYNVFYMGLGSYTEGVDSAADGSKKVVGGAKQISDGAGEAANGASTLANGMGEYSSQVIAKLSELFGEDVSNAIKRISDVIEIGKKAPATKYIIRSAEVA